MSLSYLFGDAIMRLIYGGILSTGVSWQVIFYIGASFLLFLLLCEFFTLQRNPSAIGETV